MKRVRLLFRRHIIGFAAVPLFYCFLFFLLTFPAILSFNTHFYTDSLDGLLGIWQLWWYQFATLKLHTSIWFTNYMHFPYGMSLLSASLNPFNGWLYMLLQTIVSVKVAHNLVIVFIFVTAGVTAFLLCYYFTRDYFASLVGGYIYTFSNFHFARLDGHLEMASLEFIPLFVLCWFLFLKRFQLRWAILSAFTLYINLLNSNYFFLYCILFALFSFIVYVIYIDTTFIKIKRANIISLITFILLFLMTSGTHVFNILKEFRHEIFLGIHNPKSYSLDLFALVIPGGHWRFANLTSWYWSREAVGNITEGSVHLGISTLILFLNLWWRRKFIERIYHLWMWIFVLFVLLSFGPILHILKTEIPLQPMPYTILESIFPPIRNSGAPIRLLAISVLAMSVICAKSISILRRSLRGKIITILLLTLLFIEYLPKQITLVNPDLPDYIKILKQLPQGAVADLVSDTSYSFYYQIFHQKPLAFGSTARTPYSIYEKDLLLKKVIDEQNWEKLCSEYHIRYIITDKIIDEKFVSTHYNNGRTRIYDLYSAEKNHLGCRIDN